MPIIRKEPTMALPLARIRRAAARAAEPLEGRRLFSTTLFSTGFETANVSPASFTSVGYTAGSYLTGQPSAGTKFTSTVTTDVTAGSGSAAVATYSSSGFTGTASNAQYVQLNDLSGISRLTAAYYVPSLPSIAPLATANPVIDVVATIGVGLASSGAAAFGLSAFDGSPNPALVADVQVNAATGQVVVGNGTKVTGFTQPVSSVTFVSYELRINYQTQTYDVYEASNGAAAFTDRIAASVPFITAATTFTTAGLDTVSLAPTGTSTGLGLFDNLSISATAGNPSIQLTGTTIGTPGSFAGLGNTIAKATDGNLSTFFDGPGPNGNYVGLDLGSPAAITSIAYASRSGFASRMNGGTFQASNSADFSNPVTLYTIPANANPSSTALTIQPITVPGTFRYVRYLSPAGSYGNVSEIQFFGPAAAAVTKLSGTTYGTAGSYNNDGNTIANATDGNLTSFFDSPTPTGGTVDIDLGSAKTVTEIGYAPRAGFESRMVGGEFQASTSMSFSTNVITVYTITAAPPVGQLTTVNIAVPTAYQYWRYVGPTKAYCNIAEFELFNPAGSTTPTSTKLTGTVSGTAGSYLNDGNTIAKAVDGDVNTFFDAPTANGNVIVLDLGSAKTVTQISYAPRSGWANRMIGGVFQASNTANFSSGVVTAYTITSAPTVGSLTSVLLNVSGTYRYWRYVSPAGSYGNIAEFQLFGY